MITVADTGPLIGLAKIGKLALLQHFASEVRIPPIVHRELLGKPGSEIAEIDLALQRFIHVVELAPLAELVDKATMGLDEGEKQAIALASPCEHDVLLLMDDLAGRRVARQLAIPMTGLVGLLISLKQRGDVEQVTPLLHALRRRGYWLSDKIIRSAGRQAGEA